MAQPRGRARGKKNTEENGPMEEIQDSEVMAQPRGRGRGKKNTEENGPMEEIQDSEVMAQPRGRARGKKNTEENGPMEEIQDSEVEEVEHASTMDKFKRDLNKVKGDNRLLKEEIRLLKEENRLLKEQRDFNQEKARLAEAVPQHSKGSRKRSRGDSSDSSDSVSRKRKDKKRRRKHRGDSSVSSDSDSSDDRRSKKKPKKQAAASFGKRVLSPEDVVHRYKKFLKSFKKTRSITTTCDELDVDRNTIAMTAVIADVLIAGEGGDFGELPKFKEKQTLANYAKECKIFLDSNVALKTQVENMRTKTELLRIAYKLPK